MKLKDKILVVVVTIIIVGGTFTFLGHKAIEEKNDTDHFYPQTMIVTNIKGETVTVQDFNGFLYQFDGAEDWEVGDVCSCIMDDNGTEKVIDDKIVKTRYGGFFEGQR